MSTLSDVERIAIAVALMIVFALCVLLFGRIVDAEHRLADTERRLTDAEHQPLPDSKKGPIGFWHFQPG